MGVADLEKGAGFGPGLLEGGLDEFVDELGDQEAQSEAHPLKLAAEEEVGDEAAEGDEDRDKRDPG